MRRPTLEDVLAVMDRTARAALTAPPFEVATAWGGDDTQRMKGETLK